MIFCSKFSKNCLKTSFLACFFKKSPATKVFFLKIRPLRENPRSAPVNAYDENWHFEVENIVSHYFIYPSPFFFAKITVVRVFLADC